MMLIFVNIQSCSSECSKVSFPNCNSSLTLSSERGQEDPMVPFPFIILRMRLLKLFSLSLVNVQEKKAQGAMLTYITGIVTETQIQKRGYSVVLVVYNS